MPKDRPKALVIGIGGGGDIAGTVLVEDKFRRRWSGSLLWDSFNKTGRALPWSLEDVYGIRKVSVGVGIVNGRCHVRGVKLNAMRFARCMKERVVVFDLSFGEEGVRKGLLKFVRNYGVDVIVGVDVGGDILVLPEDGEKVISPLADSLMLSAISSIPGAKIAIVGASLDGEIPFGVLMTRILKARDSLIAEYVPSDRVIREFCKVVEFVVTNTSKLLRLAYLGELNVPEEAKKVYLFEASSLLSHAPVAIALKGTRSFEEAEEVIRSLGLRPESDYLRELLKRRGRRPLRT